MYVEVLNPGMHEIADADQPLVEIARGLMFGEGPVWDQRNKWLYYVDIIGNKVMKWVPGVGSQVVLAPSGHLNGMTLDSENRLIIAGWSSRNIWRLEKDGSLVSLASRFEGKKLSSPNDICIKSDGAIYWTEMQNGLLIPGMEGDDVQRYLDWQGVIRLEKDGSMKALVKDFAGSNGLCFSPDEKRMYVNDTPRAHIRVFDVLPDGTFGEGRVFYTLIGHETGHADGMKVDRQGNVYCTGPAGIHVIAPDGTLLGRLHVPGTGTGCTNMAWGGDDWRTLFITTRNSVFRTRLKIPGIPVGVV
jgi:gluconolactonase